MKRLFLVFLTFVFCFFSLVAMDTIYFVEQDKYFIDGKNVNGIDGDFSIDFYNLTGYNNQQDAQEEKNGQMIGIQCYLNCRVSSIRLVKWIYLLKEEFKNNYWFVRQQEPFYSLKQVAGKFIEVPSPVAIIELPPLSCYFSLEKIATGEIGVDMAWMKGLNIGLYGELSFILQNPRNWWFNWLFGPKLSMDDRLWVELAELVATNLKNKDVNQYSNADKVALYIALELVRYAYSSTIHK